MTDLRVFPQIGSKYAGPPLDRPALRTLPIGWRLEVEKPKRDVDGIVGALIIGISIFLFIASVIFGWIK